MTLTEVVNYVSKLGILDNLVASASGLEAGEGSTKDASASSL